MKPSPAPNVPGKTEAERFDNAVRKMFSVSKEELLERKAEWQRARQEKASTPKLDYAMTRKSWIAVALASIAVLAVLVSTFCLVVLEIPHALHTRVYWLFGSRAYKREVLASSRTSAELQHAAWQGDGWGGVPVGDWMGYVVYDPNNSLPITSTGRPPIRVPGIPCDVVAVRRLEKNWYSVVIDMNQFWDTLHPNCRSRYEQ